MTLAKASSSEAGLKSGEYGGRYISSQPRASTSSLTDLASRMETGDRYEPRERLHQLYAESFQKIGAYRKCLFPVKVEGNNKVEGNGKESNG